MSSVSVGEGSNTPKHMRWDQRQLEETGKVIFHVSYTDALPSQIQERLYLVYFVACFDEMY